MKLDTVKKLEGLALNVDVTPSKRAFAAVILLMAFTSLRFPDAQRLRSLEMNADSAHGTLLQSKTKRPHGLPWPWACPFTGMTGSDKWVLPIFDFHRAHAKTNGPIPSFVFPRLDHKWELGKAGPAAYATTRRKLALLCIGLGAPTGRSIHFAHPRISSQRPPRK